MPEDRDHESTDALRVLAATGVAADEAGRNLTAGFATLNKVAPGLCIADMRAIDLSGKTDEEA